MKKDRKLERFSVPEKPYLLLVDDLKILSLHEYISQLHTYITANSTQAMGEVDKLLSF